LVGWLVGWLVGLIATTTTATKASTMAPGKLATVCSVFEQNIQKNIAAGYDHNILGQPVKVKTAAAATTTTTTTSRQVSRRLYVSQTLLSDGSSNNNSSSSSSSNNNNRIMDTSRRSSLGRSVGSGAGTTARTGTRRSSVSTCSSPASSPTPIGVVVHNSSNNSSNNNNNISRVMSRHQSKGELTKEPHSRNTTTYNNSSSNNNHSSIISSDGQKLRLSSNFQLHQSRSKSNDNNSNDDRQQEGSISSLAHHLEKLNIPSRHRYLQRERSRTSMVSQTSRTSSTSSQASMDSHRNRIQLPVFRQASYDRTTTATKKNNSMKQPHPQNRTTSSSSNSNKEEEEVPKTCTIPSKLHTTTTDNIAVSSSSSPPTNNNNRMNDDSNQSYGFEQLCESRKSSNTASTASMSSVSMSSSVSLSLGGRGGGGVSRSELHQLQRKNAPTRPRRTRSNNMMNNKHKKKEDEKENNKCSPAISWIRPSAVITDDDETCSSSHHSMPFKSVPFARSTIKRLNDSSSSSSSSCCSSSRSLNSSGRTLGCTCNSSNSSLSPHFSPGQTIPHLPLRHNSSDLQKRRRQEQQQQQHFGRFNRKKMPTLKVDATPDPEEAVLLAEIEAIKMQMEVYRTQLLQQEEGTTFDLRRIQEAKERKLKRIDATRAQQKQQQQQQKTDPSKPSGYRIITDEQAVQMNKDYKQAKLLARQLKQENARMDDQNRKMKLQVLTTIATNDLLAETAADMRECIRDAETSHEQSILEHDKLVQLSQQYQRSIANLEQAIDKKHGPARKARAGRLKYEDKIDIIVDMMQQKCQDLQLVEELTELAQFEDEDAGWETGSESDSEDSYLSKTSFCSSKSEIIIENGEGLKRPVEDLLIPTSSHSLHIFLSD